MTNLLPSLRGRGSVVALPARLLPGLPHTCLDCKIPLTSHCLEVSPIFIIIFSLNLKLIFNLIFSWVLTGGRDGKTCGRCGRVRANFFPLAVLIFWLLERKLAKTFDNSTVLFFA